MSRWAPASRRIALSYLAEPPLTAFGTPESQVPILSPRRFLSFRDDFYAGRRGLTYALIRFIEGSYIGVTDTTHG